ncbi:MAG: CRISPR system precrRNA processing endoribonuclease RAMP protein Cas6 [Bryobacteraceae bacterium]
MRFAVHPLRLTFEARDPIFFPPGKAGNVLRGALGHALEDGLFRPKRFDGPSGLADPPRPFVFRVRPLEGKAVQPGQHFTVDINLFSATLAAPVSDALATIAAQGLGPGRGKAALVASEQNILTFELDQPAEAISRAQVLFLTPTEIKGHNGQLLASPGFDILIARIRDRISTLRSLYAEGPLDMDFRAFADHAATVRMTSAELQRVSLERTSTRTGQRHPLGGFQGAATYEGELGKFAPYLHAAALTGVGRQTVWGKGEIAFRKLD